MSHSHCSTYVVREFSCKLKNLCAFLKRCWNYILNLSGHLRLHLIAEYNVISSPGYWNILMIL